MKIAIAADHAGVELKARLLKAFPSVEWVDLGPYSTDSVDYPDYAQKMIDSIESQKTKRGVLICGSGIGMSIAVNRSRAVRAALCESETTAVLSRQHNDSNVLCLGARIVSPELAEKILASWIKTEFSNEERHSKRIRKMS